jgi:hypothetical protein
MAKMVDKEITGKIREVGYQPFIMIRKREQNEETSFLICQTQNEAGDFVQRLATLGFLDRSAFVKAIDRALQLDVYDAADIWYRWANSSANDGTTVVLHGLAEAEQWRNRLYVGYPVIDIDFCGHDDASAATKLLMLTEFMEGYFHTHGNDSLRFSLIEGAALGISKIAGALGEIETAVRLINRALEVKPYSIHLKAAKQALLLRADDKPVPPRLQKFIGNDDGYLKRFVCPEPFKRFDIGPGGDVLVCCGHWVPTSIGNFIRSDIPDVLNSPTAQAIRKSVTDGTYKYCNHLECGALIQENIPTREEVNDPIITNAIEKNDFKIDTVDQVLFGFDRTCNLSCPSCRTERITEKVSESDEKAHAVAAKLLPLLPKLKKLNINPAGELFASKPSRRILELISPETCPDLVLDIISNGTLFSEQEWNKFPGIHTKVRSVRISVDAARKETFETLRRLGKHDVFVKNMQFLSRLRADAIIPQLKFSFTYQLQNFREMPDFVEFCESMNCDFVIFERLQNLGAFTDLEFRQKAVHLPEHPLHAEFLDVVRNPIFRTRTVWHDFDYEGVELLSRDEVRKRMLPSVLVQVRQEWTKPASDIPV